MDELDVLEVDQAPKGIPVFLKVLCILTFVGSGIGVLGALIGLATSGLANDGFRMMEHMDNGIFGDFGFNIEQMIKWQKYMNFANLGGSLLCLTGALLMWRLKKTGYFLYVPGVLIPLVVSAIGMQYIMTGFMASMGIIGVFISGLIAAAFIVMYGLNFKHLK